MLRKDSAVLEIGCGIGRMLRFLGLVFDDVHRIDVSPEMIAQSKTYLGGLPNVTTEVGDGGSLSPYRDGSFDFVFSYQVFQHIPDSDVIRSGLYCRRLLPSDPGAFGEKAGADRAGDAAG